ncbi:hypothetical protein AN958_05187 [Leucoagaricus sp. SymC.cos]|nr:hypothetical protein AN958_05187 [Leucoagaricus sp. SymC.cos]
MSWDRRVLGARHTSVIDGSYLLVDMDKTQENKLLTLQMSGKKEKKKGYKCTRRE